MNRFLSLGLGVQSTAIYFMSSMGILPRMDAAIFADLGGEKKGTLEYLEYLESWASKNSDIPINTIRNKNLQADLLNKQNSDGRRFSSIPAYTKGADGKVGMLRRQCTGEYKIEQVDSAIRTYLEFPNMRGRSIEIWKGISLDEMERMRIPEVNWKTHVYPFCGYKVSRKDNNKQSNDLPFRMTRTQIIDWYKVNNLRIPPKSSCIFCPYTSEDSWKEMKEQEPEDFEAACLVDDAIRDSSKQGVRQPVFLHESLTPLREVIFQEDGLDLWKGECSGECHT